MAKIATVKVTLTNEHQKQLIELCERFRVENARLRELVRDMGRCITYQHDCTDCTINGEGCDASVLCSIRTGELGIEVD